MLASSLVDASGDVDMLIFKLATRVRFSASASRAEEHGASKASIPCAETGQTAGLLLAHDVLCAGGGVVLLGCNDGDDATGSTDASGARGLRAPCRFRAPAGF